MFPEIESGAEFVGLEALLLESDFVVLTCPLTNETKNLFDRSKFQKMKKSAIFVNTSRGGECRTAPNCQVQGGGFVSCWVLTIFLSKIYCLPMNTGLYCQINCQACKCVYYRNQVNQGLDTDQHN